MKNGRLVCRWLIPNAVVINGVVLQKNVFCRGTFFRVVSSKKQNFARKEKGRLSHPRKDDFRLL